MSGERYYYYLKLINSPADNSIDYFMDISQQLENDAGLDENEIISLENIINDAMARYNRVPVRVVNSVTGMEEEPPKTTVDDFGGNAIYLGIEKKYGIEWKVYEPKYDYSLLFKKWYYNENISKKLNTILRPAIPGRLSNYFDIPPWMFGTSSLKGIKYVGLKDIIDAAVSMEVIPNKYHLVSRGIPKEFIDHLKEGDMWI